MATETFIKNGECYFLDEEGSLWLAESFVNDLGEVYSIATLVNQ
jgi:hypothetical protein